MDIWLHHLAGVLLLLTLPGTLYLLVLSIAALFKSSAKLAESYQQRIAIVVPAHNEAACLPRTLQNLCAVAKQDGATDVVVIADNCTDHTAQLAQAAGVIVLQREDAQRRGKGYALDFAFKQLSGYGAFVVVDADSVVAANFLSVLRQYFAAGAQVLQTRYQVLNADDSPRAGLAEIALAAFNVLRPRARQVLQLSVGILGNGFAVSAEVLRHVPYRATSLVEDWEYHWQLLQAGYRVTFVDETDVRGEMPTGTQGSRTQHARWQGGRLRMLLQHGGSLLQRVCHGQWRYLDLLLDLCLLPLAYHVLLLLLAAICGANLWWLVLNFAVLVLHVLIACFVARLPWQRVWLLWRLPFYLVWKLSIVWQTLLHASTHSRWIRTNRHGG